MMDAILWMSCAIYTLHTMELILTVFAALLSGFLMKLLIDQFRNGSKASESDELELLQNRFSAEMLRKDEAEKLLQDEMKAADMRNVELQVQYAKALHFVEQLRAGASVDNHELETEDGRQILHNLQDKITRQERNLLELEQQLQQANRSNEELTALYRQATDTSELQQQGQANTADDMRIQKAGIKTIRTKADEVATTIEQFRDHLTTILRDSYSYDQLLTSNERLQSSIQKLQDEKRLAEEQLQLMQQLLEEKVKLEEQSKSSLAGWQAKEQSWLNQILAFESTILKLKEEIISKEKILQELMGAKEEMQATIDQLYSKLEEKERQSKEMLRVVKDIESRFAHFYSNHDEAPVVDEKGEMQYR